MARWVGVAGLAGSVVWLIWMFHTLGRNLTDTVVTRRAAYFVDYGPYRWVRNPMYTGILLLGMSLGLALGTWLLPIAASLVFTLLALRTRTEERYLIERFGDQYRAICSASGAFFPSGRVESSAVLNHRPSESNYRMADHPGVSSHGRPKWRLPPLEDRRSEA
jgi:protein-S-isoprenylcysteine O-methyltransferase Ste14